MAADVAEYGYVESMPMRDGRNMIMVIGPHKKKAEAKAEARAERADPRRRRDEVEAADAQAPEVQAQPTDEANAG
jgi:translation initiation factor IF-3